MIPRVSLPPRRGEGRGWGQAAHRSARDTPPETHGRPVAPTPSPSLSLLERGRSPRFILRALLAVFALLFAAPALAAPTFPPLTGRVVDAAHVLDATTVQAITARSQSLEQSTGRQLVVATVPSLDGLDVQDYGYQLLRAWKIGQAGKNDGVVFVVAPNEKKVGIETGYGVEATLTDALSSVILQEKALPKIRGGDVNGGVLDGANAIADQLALPDDQAQQANTRAVADQADGARHRHSHSRGAPGFVGLLILFFVLSSIFRGRRGGRGGLGWLPWVALGALSSRGGRDDGWGGGFGGGGGFGDGGGGGGFSGGGGSGGGGGASGSW